MTSPPQCLLRRIRGRRNSRSPHRASLEADGAIQVRRDHLGLGQRDVRVVAELGHEQRLVADDVDERRTAGGHAVIRNAQQVAAPVADVATGLVDVFERENRTESSRAFLGGAVASGIRHGETSPKLGETVTRAGKKISGVGAFTAGGNQPHQLRLSIGELQDVLK